MGLSQSDYESVVLPHYGRLEVQGEIVKFCQNRWVAIHCEFVNPQGYSVLLRYQRGVGKSKAPLTITKPEDIYTLLKQFERLKPRTFYASVNVYKELTRQESVKDLDNIMFCAPIWDIDNTPEKWRATIEVAKEITAFLLGEGVSKSVFLKWSGKGAHVHLHHRAFSPTLLQRFAPLDIAHAIVEYVNRTLSAKFVKIVETHKAQELTVENEIDLQRVFTCPLSLHRSLNRVAVCISPASLDDFTPDWAKTEDYRHWKGWNQFKVGEADALAEKAYRAVGAYTVKTQVKAKPQEVTSLITEWLNDS